MKNKTYITEHLNTRVLGGHKENPLVQENFNLVNEIISDLNAITSSDLYFHSLHRKGIVWLLERLKNSYLEYIPTNVLRNSLTPFHTYISITQNFIDSPENKEDLLPIFIKDYSHLLYTLDYMNNIEDKIKKGKNLY